MSMLDRGERSPTIDTAAPLAKALNIPLDTLIAEAQGEWVRRQPRRYVSAAEPSSARR
jgi:transcriptional regulator with XRE-family HTH domain